MSIINELTEQTLVDALDLSVRKTFRSMLEIEIDRSEAVALLKPSPRLSGDASALSVVIGWTGELNGSMTLTMSERSALGWTNALLGQNASSIDQEVVDAVGELANIIVGNARAKLDQFEIESTLPVVIHAGLGSMGLQTNSLDLRLVYDFMDCQLTLLVALQRRILAGIPTRD
ncbi:MAG: chemotaxis protein CheX [Planctomycetota bacterium]